MPSTIVGRAALFLLAGLLTACGSQHAAIVQATPSPTPTGLPAALYGGSDRVGSVIDGKHAIAVIEAFWPIREQALHDRDTAMLRKLETGPALAVDVARSCFCPPHVIRPHHDPLVVVQRQASYPAVFLGIVVTKSQSVAEYQGHPAAFIANMVFTRSDASSPWLLTIWSGYTGAYDYGNFEIPQWDPADPQIPGSEAFSLAPPSRPGIDASRLGATLAAEWQSWANRGVGIPSSPFSTVTGKSMRASIDDWKQRGITERLEFRPDSSVTVYQFALFDKIDFACSAVDYEKTLTPTISGNVLYQADDQSEWGPALEAGEYQSITFAGVAEVCFYIQSGSAPVTVYTPGLEDTGASGMLANQPATPAASRTASSI